MSSLPIRADNLSPRRSPLWSRVMVFIMGHGVVAFSKTGVSWSVRMMRFPISSLGHVLTVCVDVLLVRDQPGVEHLLETKC